MRLNGPLYVRMLAGDVSERVCTCVSLSDGASQSASYICLLSVAPYSADMFKMCVEACMVGCAYAYKVFVCFLVCLSYKLLYIILVTSVLLCVMFVYMYVVGLYKGRSKGGW